MATRRLAELSTVILTLALAPALLAQDFNISWHTIDGGGEMFCNGGNFELSGTIAQPDAGTLTGGDSPPCDPCHMNCDGDINALDIENFIDLLFNGATPCAPCTGDTNADGNIDALDIEPFLTCLFGP